MSSRAMPVLMGIVILVAGIYIAFVYSSQQFAGVDEARDYPHQMGVVIDMPVGTDVIVSGIVQPGDLPDDFDERVDHIIQSQGFIAYAVDKWEIERVDRENGIEYRGIWRSVRQDMLPIMVEDDGYSVTVQPDNGLELTNTQHRETIPRKQEQCEETDYDDGRTYMVDCYRGVDGLLEGSLQVRGITADDRISVVGTMTDRAIVDPNRLFVGTREQLLDDMGGEAGTARMGGFFAMFVGIVFLIFGLSQMPAGSSHHSPKLSSDELAARSR